MVEINGIQNIYLESHTCKVRYSILLLNSRVDTMIFPFLQFWLTKQSHELLKFLLVINSVGRNSWVYNWIIDFFLQFYLKENNVNLL